MSRNPFVKRTEISMRDELINMLDGTFPEMAKAQRFLWRRLRLDDDGLTIPCECVDLVTLEPDIDNYCPYCMGEGKYWDEEWIDLYKVIIRSDVGNALIQGNIKPGIMDMPSVLFYAKYDAAFRKGDKIIDLNKDIEGDIVRPYTRTAVYRIGLPIDLRSDNGRLEYWKLACFQEKLKFLNGPNG